MLSNPTGLDVAAIVDPNIRRAWSQTVGPITFTDTTNHGTLFRNNVKALFGASSPQSSIYQDGTDLIIQPQEVGTTAVVKLGSSSDKHIQLNKIGLGTTAVSALNWIAFNQTVSTGRGALSFTLGYTGSGTLLANVASSLTHQGTASSGTIIGYNSSMIKDQDQSGTASYYSVRATIATAGTRSITQGVSNMYAVHIDNAGVGTAHTGGTIRQYGVFINALGTYTGVGTYDKWGILSSEDVQINDDKYLILGGSATTKATNRIRWNAGASAIDTEVNGTVETTLSTSLLTLKDALNIAVGTTTGTKIGTGTTQKLGFWNAAPIAQPTVAIAAAAFVANTSAIANDTATFDGYTIGQVVKALRNEGLLA